MLAAILLFIPVGDLAHYQQTMKLALALPSYVVNGLNVTVPEDSPFQVQSLTALMPREERFLGNVQDFLIVGRL